MLQFPQFTAEASMSRSTRARRAAVALALAIWSQACSVHRPIPLDGSLRPGSDLRIRSAAPLELTRQTDSLPPTTVCCAKTVEGRLVRFAGDTIVLERGSGVAVTSSMSRIPGYHEILTVIRTSATDVTVREIDRGRTAALVLGITATVIGLLALAASQIEYSFPTGDGAPSFLGAAVVWP
jgi:hypothetical protein